MSAKQLGEVSKLVEGEIGGAAAFLADDVMVLTLVHQVDHSGTVPEMDVPKMACLLEHVDDPVNRGRINPGAR